MLKYKGYIITLEGLDGAGKTTAIDGALETLRPKYRDMLTCYRDPGSTEFAEKVRWLLLDSGLNISKWAEYHLYVSARADLFENKIKPDLKQGKVVIVDRFYDSTIVYQGFKNGIPLEVIFNDNKRILQGIKPNLTLLYRILPEIAMQRNASNGKMNRIDRESIEKHQKVYEGYEWIARKFGYRVKIIDALQSKEKVKEETIKILDEFLANVLNPD
ncbi:MAG: dTMP kinase [Candidatus Pacearchaeota archaeon]